MNVFGWFDVIPFVVLFFGVSAALGGVQDHEETQLDEACEPQPAHGQRLPEWLRPFHGRGLIARLDDDGQVVEISAGSVIDDDLIAKLAALPKLKRLDIQAAEKITGASLRHIGEMPALEWLQFYDITLPDESLAHLRGLKTLRELSLRGAGISDDGVAQLKDMQQLRALRLGGNRITDAGIAHLKDLTNLEVLEIPRTNRAETEMKITDAGLKHVGRFAKLRELNISGLPVSNDGLAQLAGLRNLRVLDLGGTQISGEGMRPVAGFPELESLTLAGRSFDDAAMQHVGACGNLKYLHLGYTRIGDQGLRHVGKLRRLEHLSIDSRAITDAGLAHLARLMRLSHVHLRASQVTDAGLQHISQIKSLTYLSLSGSGEPGVRIGRNFTGVGYAHLAMLPNLRRLNLTNADVRWTELRELKQLTSLDMLMPTMSQDDVRQLQRALPDTHVSAAWGGGSVAPIQLTDPAFKDEKKK